MNFMTIEIYVPPEARECQQCGKHISENEPLWTAEDGYLWCERCTEIYPEDSWDD